MEMTAKHHCVLAPATNDFLEGQGSAIVPPSEPPWFPKAPHLLAQHFAKRKPGWSNDTETAFGGKNVLNVLHHLGSRHKRLAAHVITHTGVARILHSQDAKGDKERIMCG